MQATLNPELQTIETFEEYTLFSLERSEPHLLHMMERSKQVAAAWPELPALIAAADLCKEVDALAKFQQSIQVALGESGDESDLKRETARDRLMWIMDSMEDALNMHDPEIAKRLFSVDLPGALNEFRDAIPLACKHIRENFMANKESGEEERA
jgi:hypothetical protein